MRKDDSRAEEASIGVSACGGGQLSQAASGGPAPLELTRGLCMDQQRQQDWHNPGSHGEGLLQGRTCNLTEYFVAYKVASQTLSMQNKAFKVIREKSVP